MKLVKSRAGRSSTGWYAWMTLQNKMTCRSIWQHSRG